LIVKLIIKASDELRKDEWLWSSAKVLLQIKFGERLLAAVGSKSSEDSQVFGIDKSISEDSFAFVDPKSNQVVWFLNCILFGLQKTLEHIGQMTDIEFVMEVLGSLPEL